MQTERITVYDYGHSQFKEKEQPIKMRVDAWCLGGKTGVRAYFIHGNLLYECHGDDGHWWVVSNGLDINWLPKLKEAISSIEKKE